MRLDYCRRIHEDELLYGYTRSMFLENHYDSMQNMENRFGIRFLPKTYAGISSLCRGIGNDMFPDAVTAVKHTPLGMLIHGKSDGEAAKICEGFVQPMDSVFINTPLQGKENAYVQVCKECMKEDTAVYGHGRWYVHLEHNLPGVCVCAKHRTALYRITEQTKRQLLQPYDLKTMSIPEVDDMDAAVLYAENAAKINQEELGKLTASTCSACGFVWLEHRFSRETGAGCPACNARLAGKEIIKRRLECRFGNEYRLEGEADNIYKMKVIHVPCGELRKQPEDLIYGNPEICMGCLGLTPEKLQKRYDAGRKEWVFLDSSEEDLKRKRIKIRHLECGKEFFAFSHIWSSKGVHCPYCGNPQKQIDIRDVDDEYEIIGEYKNNRESVKFLHKPCGFTFEASKTSFLANTRCPLCSYRYSFDDIEKAVSDCVPGWRVIKSMKRGYVVPVDPEGNAMPEMTYREIIQDLKRDMPEIFTDCVKKYVEPRSIRKMIYDNVLAASEEKGCWTFADGLDGEEVTRIRRNMVQDVCTAGYIERIGKGMYAAKRNH